MPDGQSLLRSAARGDERSMQELVHLLAPDVWRFMRGMLGEGGAADRATEETFVRLARSVARYDGVPADVWAHRAARRVASDQVLWNAAANPGALGRLPHQHREVLVLRDVLGWDVDRVARTLETTVEDVHMRLLQAREALVPEPQRIDSATRSTPA